MKRGMRAHKNAPSLTAKLYDPDQDTELTLHYTRW